MFENNFTGAIPREIGKLYRLRQLRMQDNQLNFNLTKLDTLGNLVNLITLDFYNNEMYGDVPASIQNLTSLQYLYLQNEHYKPLRMKYCRQRIPNLGKYSYRIVRDECVCLLPRTSPLSRSRAHLQNSASLMDACLPADTSR